MPFNEGSDDSAIAPQGTIIGLRAALCQLKLFAPLHPIFVHFSIALTASSFGFDIMGYFIIAPALTSLGWWLLVAAVTVTVCTLASGVVSRIRSQVEEGAARFFLRLHMALGPLFFGFLLAQTIWRAVLWQNGKGASGAYLVAMGGVMLLMLLQGYLGGEMVYRFGIKVSAARGNKLVIPGPAISQSNKLP